MAGHDDHKDVKYVGDSRIRAQRTPNYPKDYSEYPGKTEPFWPNFLLKEWMVGAVVLIGFLILTVSHEPPLQVIADPTDTNYSPIPDWYFLFLYEVLKYTYASGPYTVIGTVIIPGLAIGALLLAPWLDPGPERRWYKRPIASGLMFMTIISLFILTYQAAEGHNWEQEERYAHDSPAQNVEIDTSEEGYQIYAAQSCIACHGDQLQGAVGPPIFDTGAKYDADGVRDLIENGIGEMPPGQFEGSEEELDILVEWLVSLGTDAAPSGDASGDEGSAGGDGEGE